jgi:hypothetical protein
LASACRVFRQNLDRGPDSDPDMTRWIDVPSLLSWLYVRVVACVAARASSTVVPLKRNAS